MTPDKLLYQQAQDQAALVEARINIARLEEAMESMGREIGELKDAYNRMNDKMDSVISTLAEARGGWRTLMLVGGMSTALGAGIAWAADHLLRK